MARNDGTIEREQAQLASQQQASDRNELERLRHENATLKLALVALDRELTKVKGKYFEANAFVVATTKAELNEWL